VTPTPAPRRSTLAAVLLGASLATGTVALAACGSGQITQTDSQVAAVPGINADSADGKISLRNGQIVYAGKYQPKATVPLELRLFNSSRQDAKITSASVNDPDGGTIVMVGGKSATPSPSASASASATGKPSGSATPSGSNRPSGSPSGSAAGSTPSASPSPTSVGTKQLDITIAQGGPTVLAPPAGGVSQSAGTATSAYLAITGRSTDVKAGSTVAITLVFSYADGSQTSLTFNCPVGSPESELPRVTGSAG
jgi:hypothetical protein